MDQTRTWRLALDASEKQALQDLGEYGMPGTGNEAPTTLEELDAHIADLQRARVVLAAARDGVVEMDLALRDTIRKFRDELMTILDDDRASLRRVLAGDVLHMPLRGSAPPTHEEFVEHAAHMRDQIAKDQVTIAALSGLIERTLDAMFAQESRERLAAA